MFDLNLTIDSNGDDHFDADGWARESSGNDDAVLALNSDVSDQGMIPSDSELVTRELFPVSRLGELDRSHELQYSAPAQQEVQQVQAVQARKSRRGPRSRSSQYRGVTFYRRTGRWESHIWDCGKQVYLGGFDTALAAARAYDRAAIKFRGVEADINFNLNDYNDMKQMMNLSKEEFVQTLRRQSNGFSRGSSKYRLNKSGRWDARTGEHLGIKVYDKGVMLESRFDPNAHDTGETMLESRSGSQHDLNLNLGMSASSQNENGWLEDSSKLHIAQTTTTSKLHMGSYIVYDPPLEGVPTRFQHHPYSPNFAPNNEERERHGCISQLEMQGHDPTAQNTAAASSGFSSVPNTPATYSWIKPYLPPS